MARVAIRKNETVERIPVARLHRNPWGLEVGPPLSSEDYELLRLSIQKDGIQIPLIAWRHGKRLVVLSGSNRLRIARELGMKTVPVIDGRSIVLPTPETDRIQTCLNLQPQVQQRGDDRRSCPCTGAGDTGCFSPYLAAFLISAVAVWPPSS